MVYTVDISWISYSTRTIVLSRSEKILEFRTRFYMYSNDPCDVSISNNSKMYTQLYPGTEQMYTHLNRIDRVLFVC